MSTTFKVVDLTQDISQPTDRTQKVPKKERPWPLTGGHPLRAAHNRVQTLATSLVFGGHGLAFTFIGLYYLAFSTIPAIHNDWNNLFSNIIPIMSTHTWDVWRHLFRDDGEPFMATLGISFFLYNPYTHSVKKITSPWQIVGYVLAAIAVLIPILVGGNLAIQAIQHSVHGGFLASVGTSHPNFAQRLYTDGNVASKIFTIIAGLIASRFVMPPVYDYTMRHFAARKKASGKKTHWFHPPAYQALVSESQVDQALPNEALNRFMLGGVLAAIGLAGLGIYVMAYVA